MSDLWNFLKRRMRRFGDQPAMDGLTYEGLIRETESRARRMKSENRSENVPQTFGRASVVRAETKRETLLTVLAALAAGRCAALEGGEYGERYCERVRAVLSEAFLREGDRGLRKTALLMFTSGTTGRPKACRLSHRNVIANLRGIESYFRIGRSDVILVARPLCHAAVLTGECLFGLMQGCRLAFFEGAFSPAKLFVEVESSGATVLGGTPTLFHHLAAGNARQKKACPLQTAVVSGERLTEDRARELASAFPGTKFYAVYGLTECGPRVSALPPELFSKFAGSCGFPLPRTQVRVADGELLIRSPSVMQGYFGEPERTGARMCGTWFRTGDRAAMRLGHLYVLGRADGMIIRSGVNVDPTEIENGVSACPGVELCRAFGADDENCGQKVCLWYTGDAEPAQVRKFAVGVLPPHLVPAVVERRESLELTPSGKLRR